MTNPGYRLVRRERPVPPPQVLDEAQRRVVEHAGGPLLVLAGPGTGKTTTLVETAVARVGSGVPVEQILVLTFSRKAAGELRERITSRLARTTREPIARTLHSYAFGLLRIAAAQRHDPAPRLLGGAEQDVVIRQLLDGRAPERWPAALRPALHTVGFAGELRDFLMRAVERGQNSQTLRELAEQTGRDDWLAAADFLQEYEGVTALRDPGGYDPAELIRSALNELDQNPQLLAAERARRRRIYVDEYQDTDPAQAELLRLIASGADELILVGDPDQSIYAFRGADERAIAEVDARFGGGEQVPVVALHTCRRSGAVLLEATRRVANRLPGRAEQRALVPAEGTNPGDVEVAVFRSASDEAAYLATKLRRAALGGMPWSRMAVLVRSTSMTLGTLRRAMITAGVPIAVRGDDIPLAEQPPVRLLLAILGHATGTPLTEDLAEELLTGPIGGGDSLHLRRLRRVLHQQFPDEAARLAPVVQDALGADVLPEYVRRPVQRVARTLSAAKAAADDPGANAESVLWAAWRASELGPRWERASARGETAGAAADRDLDSVVQLFDEAANFVDRLPHVKPSGFLEHLSAQQLPGDVFSRSGRTSDGVAILTAHASKGLEWDLVAVAGVQEGTWPDLRRRGSLLGTEQLVDVAGGVYAAETSSSARQLAEALPMSSARQLAEERRLFYVAATRARQRLIVTAVSGDEEQPSRFLDELDPVGADDVRPLTSLPRAAHLPGLVAELRAVVCSADETAVAREAAARELATLAEAGVPGAAPEQWWGLAPLSTTEPVRAEDEVVRISPSRVEAFLDCELRALMAEVGVRDDDRVAASLGTLIHDIAATAPDDASLDELTAALDERIGEVDFGASWFAMNERGRAAGMLDKLASWLRESRAELTRVGNEIGFEVQVEGATLAGRVDRLEQDAQGRLVVIDLKTGKSKPSADDLQQHAQLGAYQVAIEAGAFPEHGSVSGGAMLVQLGSSGKDPEQRQVPLAAADDPQWAAAQLRQVVTALRGARFVAKKNSRCEICDVKRCCPLRPEGRQVT